MFLHRYIKKCILLGWCLVVLSNCDTPFSDEQARIAIEESVLSSQAANLISGAIDLSTQFTIGGSTEEALAELGALIELQLPCARVDKIGTTLVLEYGVFEGLCDYAGQTYTGIHKMTIVSTAPGTCVTENHWIGFSNDVVTVSGSATTSWESASSPRRVDYSLHWTSRLAPRDATGTGTRSQSVLGLDWTAGTLNTGEHHWRDPSGDWHLRLEKAATLWQDSVPQSGVYTLETPFETDVTMGFSRVDEDAIEVVVSSGDRRYIYRVNKLGQVVGF